VSSGCQIVSRNRLVSLAIFLSMTCLGVIGGLLVARVLWQEAVPQQNLGQPITYPQQVTTPAQGILLVASRQMPDPRFQRSVILLLVHGEEGSLGLIINRPTRIPLSEALPELGGEGVKHRLFFGGPVAMNTLMFLVRGKPPSAHATPILEDVYVSADRRALERLLGTRKLAEKIRLYFGHAGWGPGQLNAELATGSWHLFQADAETLFHGQADTLWEKFIGPANQIMVQQSASDHDDTAAPPVVLGSPSLPATSVWFGLAEVALPELVYRPYPTVRLNP
jgi:putative transcriptional regulator